MTNPVHNFENLNLDMVPVFDRTEEPGRVQQVEEPIDFAAAKPLKAWQIIHGHNNYEPLVESIVTPEGEVVESGPKGQSVIQPASDSSEVETKTSDESLTDEAEKPVAQSIPVDRTPVNPVSAAKVSPKVVPITPAS